MVIEVKADYPLGLMGVDWEQRIDFERMKRERLAKAKAALEDSEAQALFLVARENVRYISGLRVPDMPNVHFTQAAAILPRGADPIVYAINREYVRATNQRLRERMGVVDPCVIDTLEGAIAWAKDAARWLAAHGVEPKVIGVDFWTPSMKRALPEIFPKTKFVDGYAIIMQARASKTEDELDCLRVAYAITMAGMQAGRDYLRPGVKECELQGVCFGAMFALGSEWQQTAGIITSDTAPYRMLASDKIIEHGDLVIMDVGGSYNGYLGDLTRVWVCGKDAKPTKEQIKLHTRAYNALKRAEAAIKPGATTMDLVEACGIENIKADMPVLGHGLGLTNEPPFITPNVPPVPLKPGMVFSIEPYVGEEGVGGFRIEDNVIVTETGYELISTFPFEEKLME